MQIDKNACLLEPGTEKLGAVSCPSEPGDANHGLLTLHDKRVSLSAGPYPVVSLFLFLYLGTSCLLLRLSTSSQADWFSRGLSHLEPPEYPVPVDSSGGAAGRPVTSSAAKVSHAASHQSNLSLASMTMHKGMLVTELLSERKLLQNLSRHVICRAVTCLDRQWQNSGGSQTDDSV